MARRFEPARTSASVRSATLFALGTGVAIAAYLGGRPGRGVRLTEPWLYAAFLRVVQTVERRCVAPPRRVAA